VKIPRTIYIEEELWRSGVARAESLGIPFSELVSRALAEKRTEPKPEVPMTNSVTTTPAARGALPADDGFRFRAKK
jgi:hypothetical protein